MFQRACSKRFYWENLASCGKALSTACGLVLRSGGRSVRTLVAGRGESAREARRAEGSTASHNGACAPSTPPRAAGAILEAHAAASAARWARDHTSCIEVEASRQPTSQHDGSCSVAPAQTIPLIDHGQHIQRLARAAWLHTILRAHGISIWSGTATCFGASFPPACGACSALASRSARARADPPLTSRSTLPAGAISRPAMPGRPPGTGFEILDPEGVGGRVRIVERR